MECKCFKCGGPLAVKFVWDDGAAIRWWTLFPACTKCKTVNRLVTLTGWQDGYVIGDTERVWPANHPEMKEYLDYRQVQKELAA